jgi:biotin-dependent carboxylase-like uncharacterized protein
MRHYGVPSSGAADPLSLALANRLVGNAWDATALEVTLLGPELLFESRCAFAIVGAQAEFRLNGQQIIAHETIAAQAGDQLSIGATTEGARVYIAFAGGLLADELLGSASTYLTGAFGGYGGRALEAGDEFKSGSDSAEPCATPDEFRMPMTSSWALRVCESFESDKLSTTSHQKLFDTNWTVGRRADRIGLQLEGPELEIESGGRMPSAGVFPGTVQCTENGKPYVLSVDAGTVGGYPRVAQVVRGDRHMLGQLRPGDHVRLLPRDGEAARTDLFAKLNYWGRWLGDIEKVI